MFYKFVKLAAAAFILTMIGVSSCHAQPFYKYGAWWEYDPMMPVCQDTDIKWIHKSIDDVQKACKSPKNVWMRGCSDPDTCTVTSVYSIEDAKWVCLKENGQSHYDHEVEMHLKSQLYHPFPTGRACWPW